MPVSGPIGEDRRLALLSRLNEALGEEEARTLMECLPPMHWDQLATKDDVRASEERLRAEMAGGFAEIRGEFANVYGELKGLRGELTNTRGELALLIAKQTRTLVFTMVGFALTIWVSLLVVGIT